MKRLPQFCWLFSFHLIYLLLSDAAGQSLRRLCCSMSRHMPRRTDSMPGVWEQSGTRAGFNAMIYLIVGSAAVPQIQAWASSSGKSTVTSSSNGVAIRHPSSFPWLGSLHSISLRAQIETDALGILNIAGSYSSCVAKDMR